MNWPDSGNARRANSFSKRLSGCRSSDHESSLAGDDRRGALTSRGFAFSERADSGPASRELGFAAVEDRVSVEDWDATILHLLGLHRESLFIERNGLKERLTGVTRPRVVTEVIA